jgi:hypothetical protein
MNVRRIFGSSVGIELLLSGVVGLDVENRSLVKSVELSGTGSTEVRRG